MDGEGTVNVESIRLTTENGATNVAVNKTFIVQASVLPANASFQALTWSTSDATVATVSNGFVKTLKDGVVTIIAKAIDGSDVTASIVLTVGETTGIESATASEAEGQIYDLSGRKLGTTPGKGVYILNGKKVIY